MNEELNKSGQSFLSRLLSGDAKESSKRALAIYVVIVLGTVITIVALINEVDYIILLGTWLAFAAALLGLSEYNKNRKVKHDASVKIEEAKWNKKVDEEIN